MAYHGKNPRVETLIFTDQTTGTPANPASGSHKLVDRNGIFYVRDSSGNESPLGSGAGELNVVTAPSTATGWAASNTGITVATSTTSTDLPLAGIIPTAIKITPVSSTDYVRYRFTMPASLKQKKLKIEWFQRPLSGYATGDLKVEMYKNSASNYGGSYTEFALSTDSSGTSSLPNSSGRYITTFDSDDGDYYELRIVRVAGTTALNLANVIIGPGLQPQSAIVADSVTFTPTGSWSTNTTYTGKYQRVGNYAHFWVKVATTGAPDTASLTVNLPSGMTIDTRFLDADDWAPLGECAVNDSGSNYYLGQVEYSSTTAVKFTIGGSASTYVNNNTVAQNIPVTWGNGDSVIAHFRVPITEWYGNGTVNLGQNNVEYAFNTGLADSNNTTSFGYGSSGTIIQNATLTSQRTRLVRFLTPVQPGDQVTLQISPDQVSWMDFQQQDVNITGNGRFSLLDEGAGVGFGITAISGTDVTVSFAQYRTGGSNNWSANLGYWRLKKSSGGQAVGFGMAADGIAGLMERATRVQRKTLSSDNTGTSPNSGAVGDLSFNNLVDGRWYTVILSFYEVGTGGQVWMKWGPSSDNTKYGYWRVNTANLTYNIVHTFQVSGTDLDIYHGGSSSIWKYNDANEPPSGLTGGNPSTTFAVLIEHPNTVSTSAFT